MSEPIEPGPVSVPAAGPDHSRAAEAEPSPAAGSPTPDGPSPDPTVPSGQPEGTVAIATPERASAVTVGPTAARRGSDMFGATFGGDTSGFGGLVRQRPSPVSSPTPYGGWFDEAVQTLQEAYPGFGEAVTRVVVDRGELTLHVKPQSTATICRVMRDTPDLRFELLSSLSGVDYPAEPERLHVVYHLTSMTYRRRLRIETAVSEQDPHVASVTEVYPTADFHERETWDFFGVIFDGHPALTRIFMPDDWQGHPQRKDYPLGGVPVEYKGAQIPPPDERRAYA